MFTRIEEGAVKLKCGLTDVVPENTAAAFGARCNFTKKSYWGPGLDISPHNHEWVGGGTMLPDANGKVSDADIQILQHLWKEAHPKIDKAFDALLTSDEWGNSIRDGLHTLFESDRMKAVGRTGGSYFYISAWMKVAGE